VWLLFRYREKVPKTAVERIELRKKNIRREFLASWQESRKLGSVEEVGHWLKRKLPSLDDEWLAKNSNGIADEAVIDRALVHLFSTPNIIEWFLETDREAQAGEAAEMN
jgi:hypothetical protein